MTTDMLIVLWAAIFVLPTAVAFARGRRLRWWLNCNLLLGTQPSAWVVMLMLAGRRS
jgi:hypothetical protein